MLNDQPQRQISINDVVSVEFVRPTTQTNISATFTLSGDEAKGILQLVQFEEPYEPGGIPAAIVTGRLILTFTVGDRQESREFLVYNDRLLQDTASPETFYRATEGFRNALITLR